MPSIPFDLLREVYWSFAETVPASPEELIDAVRDYAEEFDAPDPTAQLAARLPVADLNVRYQHAIRSEQGEWIHKDEELRIMGTGGRLTGAELLWELHVACHETVGRGEHHYFEGLALEAEQVGGLPPLYEVLLGS